MIFCQWFLVKKRLPRPRGSSGRRWSSQADSAAHSQKSGCPMLCWERAKVGLRDFVTLFSSQNSPDDCIDRMKYERFSDNSGYPQQWDGNILHDFIPNSTTVICLRTKWLGSSDQRLRFGILQVLVVDCFILQNRTTGCSGMKTTWQRYWEKKQS